MNKKGGLLDWFLIIAILFGAVVALVIAAKVIDITNATNLFADDATAQSVIDSSDRTLTNMDNMFLFIIVGLSLFVLISSYFVFNHPAYFVMSFFLLCIAVIVASVTANAYYDFSQQAQIASITANFPKIDFLMTNLPFYIAFMGIASAITMYMGRSRFE
jgi:uncharacterized membrane protein